jgi:hypothetical protein
MNFDGYHETHIWKASMQNMIEGDVLHVMITNYFEHVTQSDNTTSIDDDVKELEPFQSLYLLPVRELVKQERALSSAGIGEQHYKVVLVDRYWQEQVVYVNKRLKDALDPDVIPEMTHHLTIPAQEVIPGIWLAEGEGEITQRDEAAPVILGHVMQTPQSLYSQDFLARHRQSITALHEGRVSRLVAEQGTRTCCLEMTSLFYAELEDLPVSFQHHTLTVARKRVKHSAPGAVLTGFYTNATKILPI